MTTAAARLDQTMPSLAEAQLLSPGRAAELAALFKILSSDTRLRLLHALHRGGEVRVSDLAAEVGMSQQGVSNQLQRLLDRGILGARRSGTSIYYRIADPCVPTLLQAGVCLIEDPHCNPLGDLARPAAGELAAARARCGLRPPGAQHAAANPAQVLPARRNLLCPAL